MKQVVLVRHGQSAWNAEHRIQGQSGAGLSALGRRQARATADWIAGTVPGASLVTSDLERCVDSAAPIEQRLGTGAERVPELRERDFGAWTGELVEDVLSRDPERAARWRAGEDVVPEVGGESTQALEKRVIGALEDLLAATPPGGTVVAVTHGGPVWHGTRAFLGLADGLLAGVANASVTELVVNGAGPDRRLRAYNQTTHLTAALRDERKPPT